MRVQTFILRSFLLLSFLFICNIFAQDEFLEDKHHFDPARYALEDPHTVKILNSMKLSSIKEIDKEKTIDQVLELFLSSDNRMDWDFASTSAIIRYSKCKTKVNIILQKLKGINKGVNKEKLIRLLWKYESQNVIKTLYQELNDKTFAIPDDKIRVCDRAYNLLSKKFEDKNLPEFLEIILPYTSKEDSDKLIASFKAYWQKNEDKILKEFDEKHETISEPIPEGKISIESAMRKMDERYYTEDECAILITSIHKINEETTINELLIKILKSDDVCELSKLRKIINNSKCKTKSNVFFNKLNKTNKGDRKIRLMGFLSDYENPKIIEIFFRQLNDTRLIYTYNPYFRDGPRPSDRVCDRAYNLIITKFKNKNLKKFPSVTGSGNDRDKLIASLKNYWEKNKNKILNEFENSDGNDYTDEQKKQLVGNIKDIDKERIIKELLFKIYNSDNLAEKNIFFTIIEHSKCKTKIDIIYDVLDELDCKKQKKGLNELDKKQQENLNRFLCGYQKKHLEKEHLLKDISIDYVVQSLRDFYHTNERQKQLIRKIKDIDEEATIKDLLLRVYNSDDSDDQSKFLTIIEYSECKTKITIILNNLNQLKKAPQKEKLLRVLSYYENQKIIKTLFNLLDDKSIAYKFEIYAASPGRVCDSAYNLLIAKFENKKIKQFPNIKTVVYKLGWPEDQDRLRAVIKTYWKRNKDKILNDRDKLIASFKNYWEKNKEKILKEFEKPDKNEK